MPLDLEQHLEERCREHRLDLDQRLRRVRASAEAIWREQRLKWYTDHRAATHSRHIVEHLGSLLEHLQFKKEALSPHELYILLAACYLHDIGMQDFRDPDGKPVEEFTEENFRRIRKEHPRRARELIIERTLRRERDEFRIDIDDDEYLVPIALVSEGHGSAFFADTVRGFREDPHYPQNQHVRGELLTALLLMGDELDLHARRATLKAEFSYSPTSLLHHYIHHYVARVEIVDGRTTKIRRIRLTLRFPRDSDDYQGDVREWITTKLRSQCERTNPILEACTNGELTWDEVIEVRMTVDPYGQKRSFTDTDSGIRALRELQKELVNEQTVDRDELRSTLWAALGRAGGGSRAVRIVEDEKSDWAHIAKWLDAMCAFAQIPIFTLNMQQKVGRGPLDLLTLLHSYLTEAGLQGSKFQKAQQMVPGTSSRLALDALASSGSGP